MPDDRFISSLFRLLCPRFELRTLASYSVHTNPMRSWHSYHHTGHSLEGLDLNASRSCDYPLCKLCDLHSLLLRGYHGPLSSAKLPDHTAYCSPLTSAKVKNVYRCTSTSSDTLMIRRISTDRTSHLHNHIEGSPKLDLVNFNFVLPCIIV